MTPSIILRNNDFTPRRHGNGILTPNMANSFSAGHEPEEWTMGFQTSQVGECKQIQHLEERHHGSLTWGDCRGKEIQ